MLSERMGAGSFWLFFVGFNVAFFPDASSPAAGMPRRCTPIRGLGWEWPNLFRPSARTLSASA
jgi:heme/copper-type cytochrome/quinol oxidase subunit 1